MSASASHQVTATQSWRSKEWPAKRTFDAALACLVLVAASPLILFTSFAILIADRQRPFYLDERVGKNGKIFKCIKFQTMRSDPAILAEYLAANADEAELYRRCRKLVNDPRPTALGAFLRKTSLDELPQAFNVLTGDMSFVGPRPISQQEWIQRHPFDQELMASVRPGITGLWQVSGRSDLSDAERVALDSRYARDISLLLDMTILARTPVAVLGRKGAR